MADPFDTIVPGSGPDGHVCVIRAPQLGLMMAVVERDRLAFGQFVEEPAAMLL